MVAARDDAPPRRSSPFLKDLEEAARAHLDPATFAFVSDTAGQGITAERNEAAFLTRSLVPRVLRDVTAVSTRVSILGTKVASPIGIAPFGGMRLVHSDGELALAQAAAEAGVIFCAATNSNLPLEELVVEGGHAWFQLYPHRDSGITNDLVSRAVEAGYEAVVVTVDRPAPGLKASELTESTNVSDYPNLARYGETAVADRYGADFTRERLTALCDACPVPVVVKGVLHEDDARAAVEHGCAAVWVSNHGGRQLDRTPASLDALEVIAGRVPSGAELYLDGGIRGGTDIAIATALGARAVFIGRPAAFALAAGGRAGVEGTLDHMRRELAQVMSLMGVRELNDLSRDSVR